MTHLVDNREGIVVNITDDTFNEIGEIRKNLLGDFDTAETVRKVLKGCSKTDDSREPIKVYLRVRPLTDKEITGGESQDCLEIENSSTVALHPPKTSLTFKNQSRNTITGETFQRFTFSRVFGPETNQRKFFEETSLDVVKDFINGQNSLVFSYGITNAGKSYTILGNAENLGVLPRTLKILFNSFKDQNYERTNIKPRMFCECVKLSHSQEEREETKKKTLLALNDLPTYHQNSSESSDLFLQDTVTVDKGNCEEDCNLSSLLDVTSIAVDDQGPIQFCLWISFAEIYNENIYDLFEPISVNKEKKRATLKIGEDKKRNPYIKGLTEIHINNADEALKFLNIGRKHQKIASTKLNENSSRSHCIFTLKILRVVDTKEPHVARVSRLSFVDLAGSERYTKTQNTGVRLKEAGNINTSLMTLGKCVELLRYNQNHVNNQKNIPFRESKLTRLFQGFFCGKGKASMIVNVNQCASAFDETLHALKFSAIAKKVTTVVQAIQPKPRISKFAQPALARSTRSSVAWAEDAVLTQDGDEAELISDEIDAEEEEDKPIAIPPSDGSLDYAKIIAVLQQRLVEAKKQNILIEVKIRQEVSQEMAEQLVEIEKNYNDRMVEEQRATEELYEKRLDILSKSVKKARKRPRTERVEDDDDEWVSSVLLHQERVKNKEMSERIAELEEELEEELEAVKKERAKNSENEEFSSTKDQVVSMNQEAHFETESKEFEKKVERLKNEIHLKDEKINSVEADLFGLKAKAGELTVALEKQNNIMLDNGKVIEDLKREIASRDEDINILKGKNEDNEAKVAKTASEVEQMIAEHGQEINKLKNDNRKNINDLEKKLVERDEKILELQKEITESLRQKDDDSAKESKKENQKIAAFEDEIDRLQKQNKNEMCELQEIIAHRDAKIALLEGTISKINATAEEIKKKNFDITVLGKEVKKLEESKIEECECLRTELRCRDEQVEQLERTLKDYKVDLESKTTQLLTVKKVQGGRSLTPTKSGQINLVKQLEKRLQESTAALDKKNSQLITKNNLVIKLENSLVELRGALSGKNEELNGLRATFEQLKESKGQEDSKDVTINNLSAQLKEQECSLSNKSKEKEETEENLKFVEGELQILSNKEKESQEELRKLKEEQDEMKREDEKLKLEAVKHGEVEGNLRKQLEEQAGLVKDHARQVEELKRIIETKREELLQFEDRNNKEVAELNDANQALQENFDKALRDLANVQATVAERNKKLDDLENVDTTLKGSYRCKEAEITELKKELERTRDELKTKDKIESQKIKEEILKVNKNWEKATERMKTGLEEQDEVLARMEMELAGKDGDVAELRSQVEKLLLDSKKLENLTRENEKLDEQCELYKIKIFELETEVEKLQQDVRKEASKKDSAIQALRDGLEIVKAKKLDYETKMNGTEEMKKCLEMKITDLEREVQRLKVASCSESDEKTDSTEAESGNNSSGDAHYVYKPVEVESFNSSVKDRVEIDVTPITGRGLPKGRKKNTSGKSKSLKRKSSDLTLKEIQQKIHSKSAKKDNCSEDEFTPVSVTKLRKTRNSSASGRPRRGTNISSSTSTYSLSALDEDSENTNPVTQSSQKSSTKRKLLNRLQLPEGLKSKTDNNTDAKSKRKRKLFKKTEISAPLTDSPFIQSDKCESPTVSMARDVIMRRLRSRDLKVAR